MTRLKDIHLIVFLTQGMSIDKWARLGMADRELAIYKAVRPYLKRLTIVSYGGPEDLEHGQILKGIDVVCNRFNLPGNIYLAYVKHVLARLWIGPTLVKTNQMRGADFALAVARNADAKFIARCGYLYSVNSARRLGNDSPQTIQAIALEESVFPAADLCVVSSEHMLETIIERGGEEERATVVPNYIVEPWFQKVKIEDQATRICFAGRFEKPKNIFNMLQALEGLPFEIRMIGDGSMLPQAKETASRLGLDATFLPPVPHKRLIKEMADADIYLQPSLYEGHPKTILEAMALGLPVVAGDVAGISSFMEHGKTGYLCDISPNGIRNAVIEVAGSKELRTELGRNARDYALKTVGLNHRIKHLELDAYKQAFGISE